ncbi:MAG: DUF86 domain-containing protein [Chloroflexota bacterium]
MSTGLVIQKLKMLDELLEELRSLGNIGFVDIDSDWRTRRAVERNLLVLSKTFVDISQRVASISACAPVSSATSAVERCMQIGALSQYDPYRQIADFWNYIVHQYEQIDTAVLVDMVNRRLTDYEQFGEEIRSYIQDSLQADQKAS